MIPHETEAEGSPTVENLLSSITPPIPTAPLEVRLNELLAACSETPVRRRRRAVIAAAAAGVLVVVGASGVAAGIVGRPPAQRSMITCLATSEAGSADTTHAVDVMLASSPDAGGSDSASFAVELCAHLWEIGELRATAPYVVPIDPGTTVASRDVPPLVACIMPTGTLAVLPGRAGKCGEVGLDEADLR